MAEFVVPLRKESKDSLARQGMNNIRGLHSIDRKGKKNEYFFLRDDTKQS